MKKISLSVSALFMAALTGISAFALVQSADSASSYDVNKDGAVNSRDMLTEMKAVSENNTSSTYDIDSDGTVGSRDMTVLMKYIAAAPMAYSSENAESALTPEEEISQLNIRHAEALSVIADKLPGIVCWGDSLTSGPGGNAMSYPLALGNRVTQEITNTYDPLVSLSDEAKALVAADDYKISVPVVNMGVGGETTYTILARNGAIPFVTASAITIPAGKTPVSISLRSQDGHQVDPLLQGTAGMEYVTISGVRGVITNTSGYKFTRSEAGDRVSVPAGTEVVTAGSENYRDYATVIYIGQNNNRYGTSTNYKSTDYDYADLVRQQRAIIDHQTANNDKFVIVGLHMAEPRYRTALENYMQAEYGDKFLNLRKYLCTSSMDDAGLTPTQNDIWRMQAGYAPLSLMTGDLLHFNSKGYELIGNLVYDKMEQLGYFDEVFTALGIAK